MHYKTCLFALKMSNREKSKARLSHLFYNRNEQMLFMFEIDASMECIPFGFVLKVISRLPMYIPSFTAKKNGIFEKLLD